MRKITLPESMVYLNYRQGKTVGKPTVSMEMAEPYAKRRIYRYLDKNIDAFYANPENERRYQEWLRERYAQ